MTRVPLTLEDLAILERRLRLLARLHAEAHEVPARRRAASLAHTLQQAANDYVETDHKIAVIDLGRDMDRLVGRSPVAVLVDDYGDRGLPIDPTMVVGLEPRVPLLAELRIAREPSEQRRLYRNARERRDALRGKKQPIFNGRQK